MALSEVGALLGMSVLGGVWAVAWGRRPRSAERSAMLDARTQLQVRLDAVRARTAALAQLELPADARELVDGVVEQQVLIEAILSRAASPADVSELHPEIDDALESLEQAAAMVGEHMPSDDAFSGLCWIDPSHGRASTVVVRGDETLSTCSECSASAHLPARRQVTRNGRPVPFDLPA